MKEIVRAVCPSDIGALCRIYNHYVEHTVIPFEMAPVDEQQMQARVEQIVRRYPYLVCECDGVVVGYCCVHPWKGWAAYEPTVECSVYLAPGFTGLGLGRRLMQALLEVLPERGVHAVIACLVVPNEASRRLCAGLGFRRVSHFPEVGHKFGRWLDVEDWVLLLDPSAPEQHLDGESDSLKQV